MRCFLQLLSMLCSPSSWKMGSLKAISWCAIIGKMPSSSSSFSCFDSLSPSLSHLYWKKLHFVVSFWQNCTTPPFGISLGWTSIILGCIPKQRKKFGMDPKLRPSQTPTNHPSRFFWHIPHSEPNWKTCVYLKSSINQSGCGESESSFLCTL